MADIVRTFEVPNRVPGKLVFGPKRVLSTFGSIETATPSPDLPGVLCPPVSILTCQSVAGIHISVNTVKEILAGTEGTAPSDPSVGTTKAVGDFPKVESVAKSSTDPASTSHTVDLPSSIASGETLIGIIALDAASGGVSWPAGWVEFAESLGGAGSISLAWRKASGSEGANITVTSVNSEESVQDVYRISGAADPTVTPPEVSAVTAGTNSSPNPGAVTPTKFGQSGAFLFIATYAGDGAGPTTACPSGYANDQSHAITAIHIGACDKLELKTGSENPGVFAKTGTATWFAFVMVVYPA